MEYKTILVPINRILVDENFNCRTKIDPATCQSLAESIEEGGLQTPVSVQPITDSPEYDYRLLAGFRRITAFKLLQKDKIPAMINNTPMTEEAAKLFNLTENVQRQDLNIMEEAEAIAPLFATMSDYEIGSKVGKSRGWAQVRQMLLALPEEMKEQARAGVLTSVNIRDLYSFRNNQHEQTALMRKIMKMRKSGEKGAVRANKKGSKTKRIRKSTEIASCIKMLKSYFGVGISTRALAWAAGNITDAELIETFKEVCDEKGIKFDPIDNIADFSNQTVNIRSTI